jgi:cobyrinic acid a,c-diamide synthase
MYLHRRIDGTAMCGVIPAECRKTERLQRFGYVTLTANSDNLLCGVGESIRAHEFHYYESSDGGAGFAARKPLSERSWECVHSGASLYAGFPHLPLEANPAFAVNFVRKAIEYANRTAVTERN